MENGREWPTRARKLRRLTKGTTQIIVDARAYFDAEAQRERREDVTKPIKRTAACLGASETLVKKACKMDRDGEELPSDTEKESRVRSRSVPEEYFADIRAVMFAMYSEKKRVTLDTLLIELKAYRDPNCFDWVWSRATLHRVLTEGMAFAYDTRPSHYKILHEQQSISLQRLNYIQQIRAHRAEGRPIWYQDETWVTKNMTPTKIWHDENGTGGMKVPSGRGMRSIVCHVVSELGFVDGAALIFRGKKALSSSDYHSEMNSTVFLDWLEKKVFPSIPPRSVVVIDRATYHTTLTKESQPAKSVYKKAELVDWILAKQLQVEVRGVELMTRDDYAALKRVELMDICTRNKPKPAFRAQVLARKFDCDILLLPVAHPELNPIELIWADVKGFVTKTNVTFSLSDVERLAQERIDAIGKVEWEKCVMHCIEVEDNYCAAADNIPFAE